MTALLECDVEAPAKDIPNRLILTKSQIIEKWELGVYSTLAFVDAALAYEGLNRPLDIDNFIHEWRGVLNPDTGKAKKLTRKQLLVAIATLEEKEVVELEATQLALSFL